tara:strand:- start:11481 stop:11639 length:159 start_codon:yes stop_codon:yes gene_type:complete
MRFAILYGLLFIAKAISSTVLIDKEVGLSILLVVFLCMDAIEFVDRLINKKN